MGRGGISLPISMSFPISREGLAHAVKPKGVTLIAEIKGHAIRGGSQQGSRILCFKSHGGCGGAGLPRYYSC